MSRFKPDTISEWLYKTFEIVDFRSGVYTEIIAPDFRPAVLLILSMVFIINILHKKLTSRGGALKEGCAGCSVNQKLLIICIRSWLIGWFIWLGVSGNGRYAISQIVLAGNFMCLTLFALPMRKDIRWLILLLMIVIQGTMLNSSSPSKMWSMLKYPWGNNSPFVSLDAQLSKYNSDLIVLPRVQTMSAQLLRTRAIQKIPIVGLAYIDSLPLNSPEHYKAEQLINSANTLIVVDSRSIYPVEPPRDWYLRSQSLLSKWGLRIDEMSCHLVDGKLGVIHAICGLEKIEIINNKKEIAQFSRASERMNEVIQLCGGLLQPEGVRRVLPDGNVMQIFRESRYFILTNDYGDVYVRQRQQLNFVKKWGHDEKELSWAKIGCLDLLK